MPKYYGHWSNYATELVVILFQNNKEIHDNFLSIARAYPGNEHERRDGLASAMRFFVQKQVNNLPEDKVESALIKSLSSYASDRVNYDEIADYYIEAI